MPKATKPGFYAVRVGNCPGIYLSWDDCKKQTNGHPGADYKKFYSKAEAENFIRDGGIAQTITWKPIVDHTHPTPNPPKPNHSSLFLDHTHPTSPSPIPKHSNLFLDHNPTPPPPKPNRSSSLTNPNLNDKASKVIVAYTDGASPNNGHHGARAGYGVWWNVNDPRNVSERLPGPRQTNQRAEVTAAIRAIEICGDEEATLEIRTDSLYLINAVTKWHKSWEKNNWKNVKGTPVENKDLLERLLLLIQKRPGKIIWTHVRGHAGILGNEMADKLAVAGATMSPSPSLPPRAVSPPSSAPAVDDEFDDKFADIMYDEAVMAELERQALGVEAGWEGGPR